MSLVDTSSTEPTVVWSVRLPGTFLPEAGWRSFYPEVRPRRVAPSPSPVWRRAFRRALQCGHSACAGQMAAPTWFGREPLHAAVISCCVLPVARARTRSLRFDEPRLVPAGIAVVVRRRPRSRAGAVGAATLMGILAEDVFLPRRPLV